MVTYLNKQSAGSSTLNPALPRIIELVGPAGSGKTTLSKALCRLESRPTVMGHDIELRQPRHLPQFFATLPRLLPVLANPRNWNGSNGNRAYTWDEIKALAYACGWYRVFQAQAAEANRLLLLDHGPIFRLAKLYSYGPPQLHDPAMQPWWNRSLKQWSTTLDMVIWLDAPNEVLEERIKNRNQRHVLKDKSGEDVDSFLNTYRSTYQYLLGRQMAEHGLRVVRFDTSQTAIEQVISEVQKLCTSPLAPKTKAKKQNDE